MNEAPNAAAAASLSISIVSWRLDTRLFPQVLQHLQLAVQAMVQHGYPRASLSVVDNGNDADTLRHLLDANGFSDASLIRAPRNLGYGRAHNLVITTTQARFHLIMNPDVLVAEDALVEALAYLQHNPHVVAISPYARDGNGNVAYLCKRYPALLDLALRGFAPRRMQGRFDARLARYETRELIDDAAVAKVDLISGCFMFCRTEALQQCGGFNPAYFLYFEDFALSLELGKHGALVFMPRCRIVHFGGHAGRKGLRHIAHFLSSALKFYSHYGWKLY